jgi:hypothetical protein
VSEQQWGRVDQDGTVWVRTGDDEGDDERPVGQYPGATADEALAYFSRKFDDLVAQVNLFEQRLRNTDMSAQDARAGLTKLREVIHDASAVGDLATLALRVDRLAPLVDERQAKAAAARTAAREQAIAERTALVDEAERISGTDPERMQWKPSGDRMRELFESWKGLQRGPRLDRRTEDELWKRFSHARTGFDRTRRHHFAQLEESRAQTKAVKEKLVRQAEELSASTDWVSTAGAYRRLMDEWKTAGRAARKDDDALWHRFRQAQDRFFAARNAVQVESDSEYRDNLAVKESLLVEAEALLPVTDLASAKVSLRGVQERWEGAGKVPRADMSRIEGRLRQVEETIRDGEQERWRRSNPEAHARAQDAVSQLERVIAGLESDLDVARSRGDERRIRDAEQSLQARAAWLDQARNALDEFSG